MNNTNTLTVFNPVKSGEIVTETTVTPITPSALEQWVASTESKENPSAIELVFNDKIFETNSCILYYKGFWLFWHSLEEKFMSWCWQSDMDALIKECDDSDIENMNSGWELYVGSDYEPIHPESGLVIQKMKDFIAEKMQ